jgi:hypothetical protein
MEEKDRDLMPDRCRICDSDIEKDACPMDFLCRAHCKELHDHSVPPWPGIQRMPDGAGENVRPFRKPRVTRRKKESR